MRSGHDQPESAVTFAGIRTLGSTATQESSSSGTSGGLPGEPRLLGWDRSPECAECAVLRYSYALAHPGYPSTRVVPCLPQSNRRPPAPGVISAAVPNTRCGSAPSRRTSRLGWPSRPSRTRRHRRPMSNKHCAAISNAASSAVVLPGPFARRAGTTSWLLFRVEAGPYVHRATPGAWWRRQRI